MREREIKRKREELLLAKVHLVIVRNAIHQEIIHLDKDIITRFDMIFLTINYMQYKISLFLNLSL